ncbi:hypothetical protein V6N11_054100 [Hibiscus sabdariffa]|uniref:Uncharacterized protein n=1 Tax=Hibiscus sabdariffa TaxID=183260 RepID=A0ABR2S3Q6_9ROSI
MQQQEENNQSQRCKHVKERILYPLAKSSVLNLNLMPFLEATGVVVRFRYRSFINIKCDSLAGNRIMELQRTVFHQVKTQALEPLSNTALIPFSNRCQLSSWQRIHHNRFARPE